MFQNFMILSSVREIFISCVQNLDVTSELLWISVKSALYLVVQRPGLPISLTSLGSWVFLVTDIFFEGLSGVSG